MTHWHSPSWTHHVLLIHGLPGTVTFHHMHTHKTAHVQGALVTDYLQKRSVFSCCVNKNGFIYIFFLSVLVWYSLNCCMGSTFHNLIWIKYYPMFPLCNQCQFHTHTLTQFCTLSQHTENPCGAIFQNVCYVNATLLNKTHKCSLD